MFRHRNGFPTSSTHSTSIHLNKLDASRLAATCGVGGLVLAPGFARHIKLAPNPSSAPAKLNYGVRLEELSRLRDACACRRATSGWLEVGVERAASSFVEDRGSGKELNFQSQCAIIVHNNDVSVIEINIDNQSCKSTANV